MSVNPSCRPRFTSRSWLVALFVLLLAPFATIAASFANLGDLRALGRATERLQPATQRTRTAHGLDLSMPQPKSLERLPSVVLSTLDAGHVGAEASGRFRSDEQAQLDLHSTPALEVHWQSGPEWVRTARSYRRGAIPLVRLWDSSTATVALGVSHHGVPGIYLTQKIRD